MPKHKKKWVDRPIRKLDAVTKAPTELDPSELQSVIKSVDPVFTEEPVRKSGEANLLTYVILDAIEQAKRQKNEEIHWLFDECLPEPMTFGHYCDLLGIDAFYMRKLLLKNWHRVDLYDKKIFELAIGGRV